MICRQNISLSLSVCLKNHLRNKITVVVVVVSQAHMLHICMSDKDTGERHYLFYYRI